MKVMPSVRRRGRATMVAGCVLLALAIPPAGAAVSIDDRRDEVARKISRTEQQLDQSSAALATADRRLSEATTALRAAETTLARTRGELAAARALDTRMQVRLSEATQELRDARSALNKGQARVHEQEDTLRRMAVDQYAHADPNLLALSMVLNSQDATELTGQLNSVGSVLDKAAMSLERLKAARVMLAVQEQGFREARKEVAALRAEAAENLRRKASLEAEAEEAQTRITELVQERSRAREAAATARFEDLQQLRDLEEERERISALLRQRAEEARRRAAAEAAAQARAAEEAKRQAAAARRAREAARHRAKPRETPPAPHTPAPQPSSGLATPVDGYVTSSYGMRFHPVYKRWSLHDGIDYGAPCGTPVRAATSGTVVATYFHSAYGNRVIVDHGLLGGVGLGTSYNHLSGYSTYAGQRVERGEVIGYVGSTGYSTGCHLHFMVFENGATVNPLNWL